MYTHKIKYEVLTEITRVWVNASLMTATAMLDEHIRVLKVRERAGVVRNINIEFIVRGNDAS